ncbi:protein WHAT'S THIS FACTOR 1, chloroplastic [Rhodamnia argentea]|uniref:Protein WHAT'S THIS FACTOR 1, chloroplastic n=1 Tax=Rhodamnia argentea TaxID=178133 RepID=A0A8B8QCJ3_9MYRT|nr:protein WHAT'S THIS FACTOR 1, chloroplastic [Rhodamnia argentea]XP_030543889.1 protein WHAT'S THIS FACTOR 1, chloroplastic [Rhodamnia argentea]XP_048141913.1 protein WHAT'S THIS FACTOR 1, chloroplastic [Rhodamnia argentea]
MEFSLPVSSHKDRLIPRFKSNFLPPISPLKFARHHLLFRHTNKQYAYSCPCCSLLKIVRNPSLDKHVVRQNKIRFVQKLKTLLLSKPKHFIPLHILSKCRSYLSLSKPRSILSMIRRYPTIFELFTIPTPPTPFNATKSCSQLCVRLTPAASALAAQESNLKSAISNVLAAKLQKLLMLSSHHRLVLSKLVHLAPDLGLPPNFRSRLCNEHPDKFKTVDTSYGRALELVSWNPELARPLSFTEVDCRELIVDRPLKFKRLKLQKGLNLKRRHQDFLIRFRELPDVCPYTTGASELSKESVEAEKRACSVVREILGMTVEKRTLVDHLTHFRKDFALPNKLRSMIIRHRDLFYVSLKGQRDSVFLVEGYDDNGTLLEKDQSLVINDWLMDLVMEGKRIRRERRKSEMDNDDIGDFIVESEEAYRDNGEFSDDGFENLLESNDTDWDSHFDGNDESDELLGEGVTRDFWIADGSSSLGEIDVHSEAW